MEYPGSSAVDILLSTYNGSLYVDDLMESLLRQTHTGWRLIVRDDGSTDNTVEKIRRYGEQNPGRITLVEDGRERLGPCQSFARLLELSDASHIMFCDQDDVWLPDKIEITLQTILGLEARYGDIPLLVHTDLTVVDENKNLLCASFWRYQRLDPDLKTLNRLLVLNNVTGCTVMINSALKSLVLPVPQEAIIHDWWVALAASAFGRIEYLKAPTILYRQHGKNETGAVSYSLNYFISRTGSIGKSALLIKKMAAQAGAFLKAYGERLPKAGRVTVEDFSTLLAKGRLERLNAIRKNKFWGTGLLRSIAICALFILMRRTAPIGAKQ